MSAAVPFAQVGGHPGAIQTSEDGSLVIKTCLPTELMFYEALVADERLEKLRRHVPRFYGTLRLAGQLGGPSGTEFKPAVGSGEDDKDESLYTQGHSAPDCIYFKRSIVLENISHRFTKPNVLDIKLGTVLYDENATPQKRQRMERKAMETTSGCTGIRLTGFQLYDHRSDSYVQVTKEYGVSLRPDQLSEGIARFFPCSRGAPDPCLPRGLVGLVIRGIDEQVAQIEEAVELLGLRMISSSLLVVYEGSESALRAAFDVYASDSDMEGESDEESTDSEGEEGEAHIGLPYAVRLIDFAHTKPIPGQGRDEGVMLGLRTIRGLLAGRLREIEG